MKRHSAFLSIIVLVASAVLAQQATPATGDAPASKEDIQKLFEVMQIHQQMRQVMDAMMKQQTAMIDETLKKRYPQTSADKIARANRMIVETVKDMPMDAMLDDMIPIYQRHFSKTDIDAMSTFYASPTGQKMMREMPSLTSESMQASYARMQKQMDVIQQKAEQIVKEDQEKQKSTPAATPSQQKN
ncbi:MAG TPA: DUF2059 domain-containing protein [Terriglobales bacterium]|jgi:hypothetical protein|nr:DUF2059 domain-containing protein [Terriglobales bacterium]